MTIQHQIESNRPSSSLLNISIDDLNESLNRASASQGEQSIRIVSLIFIATAIIGLSINIYVLAISISRRRYIQGDFRYFIANLAIVDIICCLLFVFIGYVNIGSRKNFSSKLLNHAALAFYGSSGLMICALAPISISRLIAAICPHRYHALFGGVRQAVLISILFDVPPIALLISGAAYPFATSATHWLLYAYAILTCAAYLLVFVCNSLVFRRVAQHIGVVECLSDRSRLIETKQVAMATLAQALIPLACQVPAFLALSSALLLRPIIGAHLTIITQIWLAASPLFDALITIAVIKQYRIQTFHGCRYLFELIRTGRCWICCCRKRKRNNSIDEELQQENNNNNNEQKVVLALNAD